MAIKSAVITGASSGIGKALALQLAEQDVQVIAVARRKEALANASNLNPELIMPLAGDVSLADFADVLYGAAIKLPKPLALFHGAGYFQTGAMAELSVQDWQRSFDVNVSARFRLSQKLLPLLNNGRILFIGSDAGRNVRKGAGAYSVAQSASETLVNVLKREYQEHQVSVGAFKPGLVATEMVETFMAMSEEDFPDVVSYREWAAKGEIASAETVASFARWLLLDTDDQAFTSESWDIRDTSHHSKWLKSTLYNLG